MIWEVGMVSIRVLLESPRSAWYLTGREDGPASRYVHRMVYMNGNPTVSMYEAGKDKSKEVRSI